MTRSLVIVRPAQSARQTANKAEQMGMTCTVDPLFVIEPLQWTPPPPDEFDALMVTSANAVEFAGAELNQYADLPVLAVGETTAESARQKGFRIAQIGTGGVDALLAELPADRYHHILRLSGKDHIKTAASEHKFTLCRVYHARALPLGAKARAALREGRVILLYSARAAKILAEEMAKAGLEPGMHIIAALSPTIAQAAGQGWESVAVADQPTDDALLSLARGLCQR
ncbi:MAG: uroporphyrinogen-III synthase [Parasphingorhabdus sp.]|uniref:uroporphyrinogen-III synthase n=1 Tax=Parasphingorhabdus sp. TaxID=2709688 RepID=UPI003299B78B